jgi:predicted lipoprotein with Yx(FWY)xxD motif
LIIDESDLASSTHLINFLKTMYNKLKFGKAFLCLSLLSLCLLSCDKNDDNNGPVDDKNVKLASDATLGNVLTDSEGMTLYFFTKDVKGTSVCEGGCLQAWPVFYEETIKPGDGLDATDFATITRADGTKQTTYKGWPLYYFAQDAIAGDVKGENVNKVWFVAKPDYTLMLANNDIQYLSDINGMTLYYFTVDGTDVSNCNGGCLAAWPEFYTSTIVVPSALNKSDFKTITRSDGKSQLSYKGQPMYYYVQDVARGDNKGRGVGEKWYEIIP